jgi:hypothetical protein
MSEYFLFPRLPSAAAQGCILGVQGRTAAELMALANTTHHLAVYGATGGARVPDSVLADLRSRVIAVASDLGFPNPARKETTMSFDAKAGAILASCLPIGPGEASRDDVWAFMSLILMPDVATWRFPNQQERRLFGGVRNVFQRLWWRSALLRDPANEADPLWLLQLPEDALVGLMERPALSSNPRVALAIARGVHELSVTLPSSQREEGWRRAYKRIRQRMVLVNFDFLQDADLNAMVTAACK